MTSKDVSLNNNKNTDQRSGKYKFENRTRIISKGSRIQYL